MTSQKLPLVCEYAVSKDAPTHLRPGKICGKEPTKFFKNLRRDIYVGFCEEHANEYPEGWAAFKPVSREEAVAHEVMDS